MPIRPPALDDRSFDDLVEEVLARVPAHTPEWTHPRLGDPGRTLIELFAWLTDTLLYRANLIPERQRLAFLRLLGEQMRPAVAAQGLVTVEFDEADPTDAVTLGPRATVKGPTNFETRNELTMLPVTTQVYCKRELSDREREEMRDVWQGLSDVYGLTGLPEPYVTTPVFPDGAPIPAGFDIIRETVDRSLWFALLASKKDTVDRVRGTLGGRDRPQQQTIHVGIVPTLRVPALFEDVGPRARIPHVWEISAGEDTRGDPRYLALDVLSDTTDGLTRMGVVQLALPGEPDIRTPGNDIHLTLKAGVKTRPPRLDDPKEAERLVAWLRLRPTVALEMMSFSWAGINAVEVDQRQTITGRVVGQSDGSADQQVQLPGQSVERDTLVIHVEEEGRGYQEWRRIDDLATAGRDARVFVLDSEAGTVRFGDGVRGRVPDAGGRIRVARMRSGGGSSGNVPAGTLKDMSAVDSQGNPVLRKLRVTQPLPTEGGEDAETLAEAEKRIPTLFRHRERAVTEDDYERIAVETPGVRVGRVEVLPRFKPHQRRLDVPGVVSVMALPFKEARRPPNPRPDRPFIENVSAYLNARRPLTTELYVIGCEYVPLGISAGVTLREAVARNDVMQAVREALRTYLWSLAPGGPDATGWPLGRMVQDRELEVVVARVAGVRTVNGVNLFQREDDEWRKMAGSGPSVQLVLEPWQLPELFGVVVVVDEDPPGHLDGIPDPFGGPPGAEAIAVPVVPEVC